VKRTVTIQYDNYEVSEVKTVWTDEEANGLLIAGWILLHGGIAHKDNGGFQARPVFVLARMKREDS